VVERVRPRAPAGEAERFARRLSALLGEARGSGVSAAALQTTLRRAAEDLVQAPGGASSPQKHPQEMP
jgi:hypothetical protein